MISNIFNVLLFFCWIHIWFTWKGLCRGVMWVHTVKVGVKTRGKKRSIVCLQKAGKLSCCLLICKSSSAAPKGQELLNANLLRFALNSLDLKIAWLIDQQMCCSLMHVKILLLMSVCQDVKAPTGTYFLSALTMDLWPSLVAISLQIFKQQ